MKKLLFCRKCLCAALNRILLVDKCLLVFFLVLLTQSAYSLPSYDSAEDAGPGFEPEKEQFGTGDAENDDSESLPAKFLTGRLQILIATLIGLFCLITLMQALCLRLPVLSIISISFS